MIYRLRLSSELRMLQNGHCHISSRVFLVMGTCMMLALGGCTHEAEPRHTPVLQHWRIEDRPHLSIGATEGDDRYLLGAVGGAILTDRGNVAVVDRMARSLIIYDSAGTFLRRAGGTGSGPGEFRFPTVPSPYRGDSIAVYDFTLRRISIFDSDGLYGRDVRVHAAPPRIPADFRPSGSSSFAYLSFGRGSFILEHPSMIPLHAGGPRHALATLVELSPEGATVDTIGQFPSRYYYRDGSAARAVRQYRLSNPHVYEPLGESLIIGNGEGPQLLRVTRGAVDTIRLTIAQQPVTPELKTAIAEGYQSGYERFPRNFEGPPNSLWEGEYMPSVPAFVGIKVSADSTIWLQQWKVPYSGEPTTYLVFASTGTQIADISLPDGVTLAAIGRNGVLVVEKDSMDVQYVRGYRIIRE